MFQWTLTGCQFFSLNRSLPVIGKSHNLSDRYLSNIGWVITRVFILRLWQVRMNQLKSNMGCPYNMDNFMERTQLYGLFLSPAICTVTIFQLRPYSDLLRCVRTIWTALNELLIKRQKNVSSHTPTFMLVSSKGASLSLGTTASSVMVAGSLELVSSVTLSMVVRVDIDGS